MSTLETVHSGHVVIGVDTHKHIHVAAAEFFKVFEASGCQAATGSAAVGWLIQAWVGSARIFGSAVVEKRSG